MVPAPSARSGDILCFGEDWYSPSQGVTKQVMDRFYRDGWRVFWINPIPYRFPKVGSKTFRKRFLYKLKSHLRVFSRARPGLYVLCPLYFPLVGNRLAELINDAMILFQIRLLMILFGMKNPVFWGTGGYTVNHVFPLMADHTFIYNFCDKFSSHRGISQATKEMLEQKDRDIAQRAHLMLCSSRKIEEYVLSIAPDPGKVHYFPHGVDFEHFSSALAAEAAPPGDMAAIPRPRIGYFGTLGAGFDSPLIRDLAQRQPGWSFVLIGSYGYECHDQLKDLDNVHLLGPKPYRMIPEYGKLFDVCLMAWKRHEWADYCSPVKTLEYLALGKPVVSMPIPEVEENFADSVSIASSTEDFERSIQRALSDGDGTSSDRRVDVARQETWDKRYETLMGWMGRPPRG